MAGMEDENRRRELVREYRRFTAKGLDQCTPEEQARCEELEKMLTRSPLESAKEFHRMVHGVSGGDDPELWGEPDAGVIAALDVFRRHGGSTRDDIRSAAKTLSKHIDDYNKRRPRGSIGQRIVDTLVPEQTPRPGVISFTGHRYDTLEWVVLAYVDDKANDFREEYKNAARALARTDADKRWLELAGVL